MNICYVTEYFPPFVIGGAEVSTYHHAKALVEAGHRAAVITPNFGAKAYEEMEGIEVYRYFFPKRLSHGELCNSLYFTNPIYYLYLAYSIYKVNSKIRLNVIHAQNTFSIIGGYIASKILGIPFFATLRDYMAVCPIGALCLHYEDLPPARCSFPQYLDCFLEFHKKYHPDASPWKKTKAFVSNIIELIDLKIRRHTLKEAEKIVTVSDAVGKIYASTGLDAKKLITVYNLPPEPIFDTDLAERLKKELNLVGKKIVLYVGKMSYGKGADVLINAIPKVLEKLPDTYFIFAGRDNPLIPLPPPLNRNVKILGHISHDKVQALYSLCDLVVIPSVWQEPYPRVALEALTYKKSIVATRVGGIPEIVIDRVTGMLVERGNPYELANAILDCLSWSVGKPMFEGKDCRKIRKNESIQKLIQIYREEA